jgi:FKBP-type peptidyl-prolyl cis-trans isomerase 2
MEKEDFVLVDYVGRLESGEIFDLTNEEVAKQEKIYNEKARYAPVSVIIGAGLIVPGLENALLDMNVGERKTIEIEPKDAFGERKAELVRTVAEKEFGGQVTPKPGMIVDFANTRGRIQSVANGRVRVDFNHPLAGKRLKYDIAVLEQISDTKRQVDAILDFFSLHAHTKIGEDIEIETHEKLPLPIKERISALILEYVKNDGAPVKKVKFIEVFEKQPHHHEHKAE